MTTQPLHIQHVVLSLQPGGLENGVVNVVNRLAPERFRSSVACLRHGGEFVARLQANTPVHELGWQGGNDWRLALRLARLFRTTRPDIVHTRNVEAFYYGFAAAKLAGIDCLIHSEHGRNFDDRPLRFHVQRWMTRHTDAVFTVSRQLKDDLVHHTGIPAQRVQVLANGVDLARFGVADREQVRAALGLRPTETVIGSVGRLVPVKNYPLLLQAFAALQNSDAVLVLVGAGPERASLEQQAQALGIAPRVRFLGHRDDVTQLMAAFDVFVLPSLNEGMSNTLLEAMASGVACVASNVGGNPDLIVHGEDGCLFESEDLATLTALLGALCRDAGRRAALGAAARRRIEREFSIDAMIARYERLYLSTSSRQRGKAQPALAPLRDRP